MDEIGATTWVIAEGYIPESSTGPAPEMESHETACILNACDKTAHIQITFYYSDRDPVGPYRVEVLPQRTLHLRLNELSEPEKIPKATDFSAVLRSDIPIVVQHTRLDSRQSANALMTTLAYPAKS